LGFDIALAESMGYVSRSVVQHVDV